jgi:hypothetical protein
MRKWKALLILSDVEGSGPKLSARQFFQETPMRVSSAVKNWARVHLFRIGTAVLTLALLGLCFFYSPDQRCHGNRLVTVDAAR